jgi:hypothetical protein
MDLWATNAEAADPEPPAEHLVGQLEVGREEETVDKRRGRVHDRLKGRALGRDQRGHDLGADLLRAGGLDRELGVGRGQDPTVGGLQLDQEVGLESCGARRNG